MSDGALQSSATHFPKSPVGVADVMLLPQRCQARSVPGAGSRLGPGAFGARKGPVVWACDASDAFTGRCGVRDPAGVAFLRITAGLVRF